MRIYSKKLSCPNIWAMKGEKAVQIQLWWPECLPWLSEAQEEGFLPPMQQRWCMEEGGMVKDTEGRVWIGKYTD
jgi:hypothetical protein